MMYSYNARATVIFVINTTPNKNETYSPKAAVAYSFEIVLG